MSGANDGEFIDRRGGRDIASVGPFERWPVTVNGWTVPHVEARYTVHGVTLTLDNRFALDLPADVAGSVIEWVADAIAVAMGWSCHPTSPDWEPPTGFLAADGAPSRVLPWRRMHGLQLDDQDQP